MVAERLGGYRYCGLTPWIPLNRLLHNIEDKIEFRLAL